MTEIDAPAAASAARGLISHDLMAGTTEIAAYLNKSHRQVSHLLETRQIPAFKIGGRWHMRKSTFLAHVERLERGSAVAA